MITLRLIGLVTFKFNILPKRALIIILPTGLAPITRPRGFRNLLIACFAGSIPHGLITFDEADVPSDAEKCRLQQNNI